LGLEEVKQAHQKEVERQREQGNKKATLEQKSIIEGIILARN
jgi:hypothetical protein